MIDNHIVVANPELERRIEIDPTGQTRSDSWKQPKRVMRFPDIGLDFGFESDACHTIRLDSITSAQSKFVHRLHFSQDSRIVEVIGTAELSSNEEFFRLSGSLDVKENESLIFSRKWNSDFPRKYG